MQSKAQLDEAVGESEYQDDWGYQGSRRFALELGLRMTPAERLQWLEETMEEMQALCGLAREAERRQSRD